MLWKGINKIFKTFPFVFIKYQFLTLLQCILLLEIMFVRDDEIEKIEMGIFQWYDYAANVSKVLSNQNEVEDERHVLGCPYLKLLNTYDLVPLESINRIVHIIPDFSNNKYFFVNNYIF